MTKKDTQELKELFEKLLLDLLENMDAVEVTSPIYLEYQCEYRGFVIYTDNRWRPGSNSPLGSSLSMDGVRIDDVDTYKIIDQPLSGGVFSGMSQRFRTIKEENKKLSETILRDDQIKTKQRLLSIYGDPS